MLFLTLVAALAVVDPSQSGSSEVSQLARGRVRVAFSSERDGAGDVFVMSGDGSYPTRLTRCSDADSPKGWIKAVGPSWSPDGTRIAFHVYRAEAPRALCVMNADGSELRILVDDRDATEAAWSPDGTEICFQSDGDLWVVSVEGGTPVQLTELPLRERGASWSPDGTRIAFSAYRYEGGRQLEELYLIELATGDIRQITSDGGETSLPEWSPDGQWLLFNAGDDDSADLYVIRADGTGRRALARTGKLYGGGWSPDGQEVYATGFFGENNDVYALAVDGSSLRRLSNHPGSENYVSVCPVAREQRGGDEERVEEFLDMEAVLSANAIDRLRAADRDLAAQRLDEAIEGFQAVLERDPGFGRVHLRLARARMLAGDLDGAKKSYRDATAFRRNERIALYNLACLCSRTGEVDEAFEALSSVLGTGLVPWSQVAKDPDFETIRADPRYEELRGRYGE